jgi:hypothetical protein
MNNGSGQKQAAGRGPAGKLSRVRFQKAAEACEKAVLTDAARKLLTPEISVDDFLQALMGSGLLTDAVALLAHALPAREAVWWACLAARALIDTQTPVEIQVTLESAENWVYMPTDENRRAAMDRARQTKFDHPACWAATGAFWSGGSMVPANLPAVPPAEHLTGLAVCGAVQLSVLSRELERAPERFQVLLQRGIDIGNGGNGRLRGVG